MDFYNLNTDFTQAGMDVCSVEFAQNNDFQQAPMFHQQAPLMAQLQQQQQQQQQQVLPQAPQQPHVLEGYQLPMWNQGALPTQDREFGMINNGFEPNSPQFGDYAMDMIKEEQVAPRRFQADDDQTFGELEADGLPLLEEGLDLEADNGLQLQSALKFESGLDLPLPLDMGFVNLDDDAIPCMEPINMDVMSVDQPSSVQAAHTSFSNSEFESHDDIYSNTVSSPCPSETTTSSATKNFSSTTTSSNSKPSITRRNRKSIMADADEKSRQRYLRRLENNRKSAQASRQRKRQLKVVLEGKVDDLVREQQSLSQKVSKLEKEKESLLSEYQQCQQLMSRPEFSQVMNSMQQYTTGAAAVTAIALMQTVQNTVKNSPSLSRSQTINSQSQSRPRTVAV